MQTGLIGGVPGERALRPKPCRLALYRELLMARGAEARAAMVAAADLRLG